MGEVVGLGTCFHRFIAEGIVFVVGLGGAAGVPDFAEAVLRIPDELDQLQQKAPTASAERA